MKTCRNCGSEITTSFCDLGHQPPANAFLTREQLELPEVTFPLHAYVCDKCLMVQVMEVVPPKDIFSDYPYWSSTAPSWVAAAERYASEMIRVLALDSESLVVEVGSNDGYLLQHFLARGIPVQGVDPAENIAASANAKGIPTRPAFFGSECAKAMWEEGLRADLLCGTNVLAHVPNLHDFVEGIRILLKQTGTVTMEFPHIMSLMGGNQFDTIYHEHFSYFSLHVIREVFAAHDIVVFDVTELPTHGGSIRIHGMHAETGVSPNHRVEEFLKRESEFGLTRLDTYLRYGATVLNTKLELLWFLLHSREKGKSVVCYGAPAKGNTLLNYCGVDRDLVDYVVDDSPHKQGLFLPGSHLPIYPSSKLAETQPDYVLILPWNLQDYIVEHNPQVRDWGGRWVVAIPEIKIL